MNPLSFLMRWLLRLLLLVLGLLFAASLAVAAGVLLGLWSLRALWAKLTGRTVSPFVMRVSPRSGFVRAYRGRAAGRPDLQRDNTDVTDVQPKEPRA
jgi:hypothetical protein